MNITVITGGDSGIGHAVARTLAARGDFVALADRNEEGANQVLQNIVENGGCGLATRVDVTNQDDVGEWIATVVSKAGAPTAAIACAGVASTGLITQMSVEEFDRIISLNLKGVFLLARQVIPFLELRRGTFTAIASDAALVGVQSYGAYFASKHGVLGLIKSLALDHGPKGVRCNAICPGYVETPMLVGLVAELGADRESLAKAVPLGRFAKVDDVANPVAFLMFEAGSYLNGTAIPLDAGGSAGPYQPLDDPAP